MDGPLEPSLQEAAPDAEEATESSAADLARECLYRFLSAAITDPHAGGWQLVLDPESQRLAREATDLLRSEFDGQTIILGPGELPTAQLDLAPLLDELRGGAEGVRADYDRIFGLVLPRECPPYETEYHPTSETFFRSQQLADIAGFYRAFGLQPSEVRPERPDHVALELEFMAFVLTKKRLARASDDESSDASDHVQVCDDTEREFFRDHLAWWVPSFVTGLRRKAVRGYYAAFAQVLAALIPAERTRSGLLAKLQQVQPDLVERPEEQSGCAGCAMQLGTI